MWNVSTCGYFNKLSTLIISLALNPILIDYILNWLTPKEYRLELKNRLENLCSLSGQTMSPGSLRKINITCGKIQEVIIWNGYKASKNSLIQSNTNGYYNIY